MRHSLLIQPGVPAAENTRQKSPRQKIAGKIIACKSCAANSLRHKTPESFPEKPQSYIASSAYKFQSKIVSKSKANDI